MTRKRQKIYFSPVQVVFQSCLVDFGDTCPHIQYIFPFVSRVSPVLPKERFEQLLSEVIENSLLHLYTHVAISDRFVPLEKRNALLCKFLKPKIKQPCYKPIKGEIKRMVLAGHGKGADLEAKLNELNVMAIDHRARNSDDAHRLYELLNFLLKEYGFDSRMFDESSKAEPDVIYVLQDHLINCKRPINLTFK
ncbi:DUF2913 family protein [Photobacterium proteolyticum]|uniref:DUF2913 family protein n=1 Tax=Photobacterium proteolyticum TaxID=1903952 RepID=UPI001FEAAE72|nr:DUF2913 family protein [Photobacterium proteolyticum]